MELTTLQIKVISGGDLKAFNFFQKLALYVAVSIGSDVRNLRLSEEHRQEQRTPIDKDGDGNPEWRHSMAFDLSVLPLSLRPEDLFLLFELRDQWQFFGHKVIGEVRVSLTDFIGDHSAVDFRFVHYEVRDGDGRPNGTLNFSYKVIHRSYPQDVRRITGHQHQLQSMATASVAACEPVRDPLLGEEAWRIRYPRIDLAKNATPSAPPLAVDAPRPSSSQSRVQTTSPPPSTKPIAQPALPPAPSPAFYSANYPPPPILWPAHQPPPPPAHFLHSPHPPRPPLPPPFPYAGTLPPPPPYYHLYVQRHVWGYHGPSDGHQFTEEHDHTTH
ncbi:hypothetical protein Ancab_026449 [Ancistrocladus abbreviatus]